MNILVTGSSGQLGTEIKRLLDTGMAEIGPIPSAYNNAQVQYTDYETLNIANEKEVNAFFEKHKFDLVINCAALTNVDGCEKEEMRAFEINAMGPEYLAKACEKQHATLVQVSTDYVFSGSEPSARVEEDRPNPISAYGRTKLSGEQRVLGNCSRCFVVRTAWLYGYCGKNFVKTMLWLAKEKGGMTVVCDQLGNPTSANDLAYEILSLAQTEQYGIYHATNKGTCSWFEFTQAILEKAGYDKNIAQPCTSAEYLHEHPQAAARPAFSSLDNKHLRETIGDNMRPWEDALDTYIENLPRFEN